MNVNELRNRCTEICCAYKSESDSSYVKTAQDVLKELIGSRICVNDLKIVPLWIEIYYGTESDKGDSHYHTMQANRFGRLYFHRKGRGGVDLVLSTKAGVAFSVLIKACKIGEINYGQLAFRGLFAEKGISEECEWYVQSDPTIKNVDLQTAFVSRIGVRKYPGLDLSCYRRGRNKDSRSENPRSIYRFIVAHPTNYWFLVP